LSVPDEGYSRNASYALRFIKDAYMFTFDLPGGTGSVGPSDKHWKKNP